MKSLIKVNIRSVLPTAAVLIVLAFSQALVLHEPTRARLKEILVPQFRTIISKVEGDLSGKGKTVTILKIKSNEGLVIEIYDLDENSHPVLVDRVSLKDKRDASFILRGEAVSLALEDVDQDNSPEIIVPTFDKDLVAHLQILKYDPDHKRLELVSN